jgi:membrane protease YdiL (CAAX protease family)
VMQQAPEGADNKASETASLGAASPWQAIMEIGFCSGVPTTLAVQAAFAALGLDAQTILASARLTALFIFFESASLMGLIVGFQAQRGSTLKDLGIIPSVFRWDVVLGLAIVPVLFGLNGLVSWIFQEYLPRYSSPRNPLLDLIQSRTDLVLFILLALWAGGIKEELQRAFILNRFKVQLAAPIIGLLLWSLAFGAGHAFQGIDSVIGAGLYGLLFGSVYLWRRCIIGPVIAHSFYDVMVLMGYWLLRTP